MSTLNTYNLKSPDSANTNLALDASGNVAIQAGSASTPSVYVTGDANTGLYSPGADQIAVATGGTARLYINSSGQVGVGTTSPVALLQPNGTVSITGGSSASSANGLHLYFDTATNSGTITAFHSGVDNRNLTLDGKAIGFTIAGNERARIDSSGRLLVGTSSARSNFANGNVSALAQIEGTTSSNSSLSLVNNSTGETPYLWLGRSRGTSIGSNALVSASDFLGVVAFQGNDGTDFVEAAAIYAQVDGTPGANDMPGRLVFSTTADGASSPTERMRIDSSGRLLINTTGSPGNGNEKIGISSSGEGIWIDVTASSGFTGAVIDRTASDGDLINFLQAGTQEGAISVSGTTVTYGGGHLARWSQLPNDENPSTLLKGTVMSNLDEMCEWGDEDNEQLNKTKVSNVEGDPNVAGVFVAASPSEDGPLDFFVGMTGDMIIRIGAGVTVERGDLLMSAGDGTAKPQDDDIIRSKTIAKVTSTTVSCTYDDGSYCVPCVLMAC